MLIHAITLFIVWLLSIIFHQSLFILFPILGGFYFLYFDFRFKRNSVIDSYFLLSLSFFIPLILQALLLPSFGISQIEGFGRYLGFFLGAIFVSAFNRNTINYVLSLLILFILIQLPFELYIISQGGRYKGIFQHANHYAYFLNVILYYLLFTKSYISNRFFKIVVVFISIFSTLSSGGLLTALAILFGKFIASKKGCVVKLLTFIFLLTLLLIIVTLSDRVQEQIEGISNFDWDYIISRATQKNAGGNSSFIWRLIFWVSILMEFFQESILLIMIGLGIDSMTVGNYYYSFMVTDPHNDFVKVLTEVGLIGFVMFITFIVNLISKNGRNLSLLFLIIIPLFFGNVIVNFPFNFTLILVLTYMLKDYNEKI